MSTSLINLIQYCHIVGELIFLTHTRLNITYLVDIISQYMSKPQQRNLKSILPIQHYIKGIIDLGIFLKQRVAL